MTYRERKEKEEHLLCLIEKGWLHSLVKVAKDFDCSVRTINRILQDLRDEGHEIQYCKTRTKYFLKNKK